HLDGGYASASAFVDCHLLAGSLEHLQPGQLHPFAYKSALQEWAHAAAHPLPQYRVIAATGPEHGKLFTVEVTLPGGATALGTGSSKKQAEQQAAAAALAALGLHPGG
ncbi:MAG: putative dsRNA-binding protein, partial [Terriglobales bacterium]